MGVGLVASGGRDCLGGIIPRRLGREPCLLETKQDLLRDPRMRGVVLLGNPVLGAEWGGELMVRPREAVPMSPDNKTARNLDL